jgi:hypothetical protein
VSLRVTPAQVVLSSVDRITDSRPLVQQQEASQSTTGSSVKRPINITAPHADEEENNG